MANHHLFGEMSSDYSKFRPLYPESLYQFLAGSTHQQELVWDVGTGNGQAACHLAHFFKKVVATDINQAQMQMAPKKKNISYEVCPCEKSPLPSNSVDLITIAQAIHYFDLDKFYDEVKRVSTKEGRIAAWCYHLPKISEPMDHLIQKLHHDILDDYWPKERRLVDQQYQTLPFPFEKLSVPSFEIKKTYTFDDYIGYLNTWYAVKDYQKKQGKNPIDFIYRELKNHWNEAANFKSTNVEAATHEVHWPIYLLLGKCH